MPFRFFQHRGDPPRREPVTALRVDEHATHDAPTAADATATEASILAGAGGRTGDRLLQVLHRRYRRILETRAVAKPVAYRFPRELGRGRQGVVFLGLRQGARGCITRHAIKVFDPSIYPDSRRYWADMARIAAQTSKLQLVKNPALVAPDIYEEDDGVGYLQMDVVNGISLRDLLDGTHLETVRARCTEEEWRRFTDVVFRLEDGKIRIQPGIALYIMRLVLRGLETLHAMGFIHSDIKPANIMVDRLGYVKLIDYGRAARIEEKPTFLLGTPAYMAPETQADRTALPQSDFYSLGLVALEMLRGERLIPPGQEDDASILAVKRALPSNLYSILPPHVRDNERFFALLQRFVDPDPARRPPDAEEAEVGEEGLSMLHKQLTLAGKDTEYGRELENYLSKIDDPFHSAPPPTGNPT